MHRILLATCAAVALVGCGEGGGANEAEAGANGLDNALPPLNTMGFEENKAAQLPPARLPSAGSQPLVRPDPAQTPVASPAPSPAPPPPPIPFEPIRAVPAPPPPPVDHNGMDHEAL
jgi:hypothetical protein